MKKELQIFLKSIFLFIPFSLMFYIIFVSIWGDSVIKNEYRKNLSTKLGGYGHLFSRLQNVKNVKNVDILFLGSSHTYRGFDTRIFDEAGYKSFNLGSSAQTHIQTLALLNRYLDSLNPKLIIFEVYPVSFSIDGVESSLDLISNDIIDFEAFKMTLNQNNIKVYNTFIYCSYRYFFNLDKNFKERKIKSSETYIEGGYVEKKLSYFKNKPFYKSKWKLKEDQLKYFVKILNKLKSKNINFILVQAPINSSKYNNYTNNDSIDEILKNYGEYYNFNNLIKLNDTLDFYDSNHLNQNGVIKFNKEIIKLLKH